MQYEMNNGRIAAKVKGAAVGGGSIGPLITVIVLFVLSKYVGDMPDEVSMAIAGVIAYVISYASTVLSAYFTPPAKEDVPVPVQPGS